MSPDAMASCEPSKLKAAASAAATAAAGTALPPSKAFTLGLPATSWVESSAVSEPGTKEGESAHNKAASCNASSDPGL